MKYYVSVNEFSDGSEPCEFEREFNTLGDAWDYIHYHDGYHEYLIDDNGHLTPVPTGTQDNIYWEDYSCSPVYTR